MQNASFLCVILVLTLIVALYSFVVNFFLLFRNGFGPTESMSFLDYILAAAVNFSNFLISYLTIFLLPASEHLFPIFFTIVNVLFCVIYLGVVVTAYVKNLAEYTPEYAKNKLLVIILVAVDGCANLVVILLGSLFICIESNHRKKPNVVIKGSDVENKQVVMAMEVK